MKIKNLANPLSVVNRHPWMIVLISLSLITITAITGYQSFMAIELSSFREFNERQLVMGREAASAIELFFESLGRAMACHGSDFNINQTDAIESNKKLTHDMHKFEKMGVNDIGVLDADGIVKFNVTAPQLIGTDFSWREYFKEVKKMTPDNRSFVLEFIDFKGVDIGKKGVLVAAPIFIPQNEKDAYSHSGKFGGVFLCTLKLETFTKKFIETVHSSKRGHSFLLDEKSIVLWAPDKKLFGENLLEKTADFPSFKRVLEDMGSGNSATGDYFYSKFDNAAHHFSDGKEEYLFANVPIKLGNEQWTYSVWAPKSDAKELLRAMFVRQLLFVGIVILIIILGSFYFILLSRRYTNTLQKEVDTKTEEFQESHKMLIKILESLDAIVYVASIETHKVLFANKYVRDLYGDAIGMPCWKVFQAGQTGPCDFCTNERLLAPKGQSSEIHKWEYQNLNTKKWYEARDRAITWVDGRTVRLEIASDITERKLMDEQMQRAHHEVETLAHVLRSIGDKRTLDGVGSFLIKELRDVLNTDYIILFLFSRDRKTLFVISETKNLMIREKEQIQTAKRIMDQLDGLTVAPKNPFLPPLIPDSFPLKGRQSIIPLKNGNQIDGALAVQCGLDCLCDENSLKMASLVLEQSSGTIRRAILQEEEKRDLLRRIEKRSEFNNIIGKDRHMQVVFKLIEDISPTDATVLIQGDSGTGKELVARAIHDLSPRKDNPFVIINCAAYPATLLESELFGHEKGAFTGAIRQKPGRFEQAIGGTVFLDEIGEIPPTAQIKLLRVLQTHKLKRVGGEKILDVDVRILAATNKDLLQEVKDGVFREDLYYRINVIPIHMPSLKKRRNDIPLLAKYFLLRFAEEQGKDIHDFTSEAMRMLLDYPWPGNVRELENSVEHAVVLAKSNRIDVDQLPSIMQSNAYASESEPTRGTIVENEKILLQEMLEECGWNKKKTAERLGISRSTLYGKLKKYQISKPMLH